MLVPVAAPAALQTDPLALYRTMKAAFDKGGRNGWHYADQVSYFSTVLDAGRAYELVRREDPDNRQIKALAVDLATLLHYDPLVNRDAAAWYVRAAAEAYALDPQRGAAARALLTKLDAEDASPVRLAADADADATANVQAYPRDADALLDQVEADLRAFLITHDAAYRSLALARAAQPAFPIAAVSEPMGKLLWPAAQAARSGGAGFTENDRAAARAMFAHRDAATSVPVIGRVQSHEAYLVITAPADEYFGHVKLSPLGVRNELTRIGKYLDAGWGDRMTEDAVYVVDALDDWRQQYPRDYELPRLLLRALQTLARMDTVQAKAAAARVRRTLTVDYNGSPEARSLLAS